MNWSILGESVIGTSHISQETNCQDAFRFGTFGESGEWLALVVADGAGSAKHSEIGAILACDELIDRIKLLTSQLPFSSEHCAEFIGEIREALLQEASRMGVLPRELACTFIVALVGPEQAIFAQIGDGVIVVQSEDDFEAIFWPEPLEYINATDFITDDHFASRIQFRITTTPVRAIALLTDGLERLALDFNERKPHAAFFKPFFETLRKTQDTESLSVPFREFLGSNRVNERTDDDKTLLLAIRQS